MALVFLNEVFICKYDLPALVLIIFGSSLIILSANFAMVDYDVAILKTNLYSVKSIAFFAFTLCLLYTTIHIVNWVRKQVSIFEKDVEKWLVTKLPTSQQQQQQPDSQAIVQVSNNTNASERVNQTFNSNEGSQDRSDVEDTYRRS